MSIDDRPVVEPHWRVLEGEHYSACLWLLSLDDVEPNYAYVALDPEDAHFARKTHLFAHQKSDGSRTEWDVSDLF